MGLFNASSDEVSDARSWAEDCSWKDDPRDCTDDEIVLGVDRHYEGGWSQFSTDRR